MSELMKRTNAVVGPAQTHPALVYLAGKPSAQSKAALRGALNIVADVLFAGKIEAPGADAPERTRKAYQHRYLAIPYARMRYQHVAAVRAAVMGKYAPATVNLVLSALRGVLTEAWKLGQMDAEAYQRAVAVRSVRGETVMAGRELASGEMVALVDACRRDAGPAGVRDAAILGLLATCGLRRGEVAALELRDLTHEGDAVRVLVRAGKGHKDRTAFVTGGARKALLDWLAARGESEGPLFAPVRKGGKVVSGHGMTAQALYLMLQKRAGEARVAAFSPHDFRRTMIGNMLGSQVDVVTIAKIVGHASPSTTARYDRRAEGVKRAASEQMYFPYP